MSFISLNRSIIDWEWYSENNVKSVFLHCLLKANFKKNKWRGIDIERGTFVTSYGKLSTETGLSIQNVRTSIKKLSITGELTIKTTNKNSTITVVNYEKYQATNNQITINQQSNNNQLTTTNNDNKANKENNENKVLLEKETKTPIKFNFKKELINLGVDKNIANEWIVVRKQRKRVNTETAFRRVASEIKKSSLTPNESITKAIEKSWGGFEASWIENTKNKDIPSESFTTNRD